MCVVAVAAATPFLPFPGLLHTGLSNVHVCVCVYVCVYMYVRVCVASAAKTAMCDQAALHKPCPRTRPRFSGPAEGLHNRFFGLNLDQPDPAPPPVSLRES